MPETPQDSDIATPAVAPIVRTIAYFTAAIEAPIAAFAVALTAIWAPALSSPVNATAAAVTALVGLVAGVLGVAYRPTASSGSADSGA